MLHEAKPLFAFTRGGREEVVINGFAVFKAQGSAASPGGNEQLYARSLLKPWQALAVDTFGPEAYWAIGIASHSGEARHLQALNELAAAEGLSLVNLQCPKAKPAQALAAAKLLVNNRGGERVFNFCSGKHLMLLAACRRQGLSLDYLQPTHPLQLQITEALTRRVGRPLAWAEDGCGLQTPYLSIGEQLQLWEDLAIDASERALLLKKVWVTNPKLIGGEDRVDSDIVHTGKGQLLAKEGADGLLVVQSLASRDEPAQGVFIKINSGFVPGHMALALFCKLKAVGARRLNSSLRALLDHLEIKSAEWIPPKQELQSLVAGNE